MRDTSRNATKLQSTAMQEKQSDVIEVRLALSGLEVLRNKQALDFSEQSWMDLNGEILINPQKDFSSYCFKRPARLTLKPALPGVFVFSPTFDNVTVMFPSGAGVEVRRREETMTTTVLLPHGIDSTTGGLLGTMNDNNKDDLTFSDGTIVQNSSNPEEVFSFGASCKHLGGRGGGESIPIQLPFRLREACPDLPGSISMSKIGRAHV